MKFSQSILKLHIPKELAEQREAALKSGVPVADEATLAYLLYTVKAIKAQRILEIGTAVGISGTAMLLTEEKAHLTTIELEEESYKKAKENFARFDVLDRATAYLGDAGDILPAMPKELNESFDLIFLDGPKAQYLHYLPDLKRLLKKGGVLFSDDILLYGWVDGEAPKKRHMLVEKIREYLRALSDDEDFWTSILEIGDGVAVSVKVK